MKTPAVLVIAGHDPTGGAGVMADAEAIAAQGVRVFTVITALTVQDTDNVRTVQPVSAALLADTLAVLLADCAVQAVKIGLIGAAEQVPVIVDAVQRLRVPSVLDPVLRAGGGQELASQTLQAALLHELLPQVSLLTPNAAEARRLAGVADIAAAGPALLAAGAREVLVTGGDEPGERVRNVWFSHFAAPQPFDFPRLAGGFHGAGCTLAAAIAAQLALGEPLAVALPRAQAYTHRALAAAERPGQGRALPRRLFLPAAGA